MTVGHESWKFEYIISIQTEINGGQQIVNLQVWYDESLKSEQDIWTVFLLDLI